MENTNPFVEVSTDYTDGSGVTYIDAYTSYAKDSSEDDKGRTIGFIVKGEVYWKDDEASANEFVKKSIQDAIKESKEAAQKKAERYIFNATTKDWVGERGGDSLLVDDTAVFDNLDDAVSRYNSYLQDEDLYSATLSAVILSTDYPTDPSMQWLANEISSKPKS